MEPDDKYADIRQLLSTAIGIGDSGPIMQAYLDSLTSTRGITGSGISAIPKPTIKHLGRPKAKHD